MRLLVRALAILAWCACTAHGLTLMSYNVENLFDTKYYINADSNTNISPGFARAVRAGLIVRF